MPVSSPVPSAAIVEPRAPVAPLVRATSPVRRALLRGALVFVAWTAFGLLLAEQTALQFRLRGETRSIWSLLAPALSASWLWAAYTPLVIWATRRLRHLRERGATGWLLCIAAHVALSATITLSAVTIFTWLRPFIDGVVVSWTRVLSTAIVMDTTSYLAIVTLVEAAEYAKLYRDRARAAAELARAAADLQARLDEARLHMLEAQLRPHFLYNTLNVIAELVHDDPEAADEMLTMLGGLLRRACVESEHLVPLHRELESVRAYAGILALRYRERVSLTIEVPPGLEDHLVPVFSLQPLVENAFRHGVDRRERPTAIEVGAALRDDVLVLRIRDRGVGPGRDAPISALRRHLAEARGRAHELDELEADGAREGVGLRNTRERLAALYGGNAELVLARSADETVATVRIPARRAPSAASAPPPPSTTAVDRPSSHAFGD